MAFHVPEDRDAGRRTRGKKMEVVDYDRAFLLPKYNRESLADLHAKEMEKATKPFLERAMTQEEAPHKGKRVLGNFAHKGTANLFEPYGSFPPPPAVPPNVHDYTEEQLRMLMHDGSNRDKEKQIEYMAHTRSYEDVKTANTHQLDKFYRVSAKSQHATEESIRRGYGRANHGLLDELVKDDTGPHRGKKIWPRNAQGEEKIAGFKGVGNTPGNKDPFADYTPHKVHRNLEYDPLRMREKGAAPKPKPIDDLMPPPVLSPRREKDGKQATELIQRMIDPAVVPKEVPRSTKKFPHYQVAVSQGPEMIPGFQSMGCCNINAPDEAKVGLPPPDAPHGLKKLRPDHPLTHHAYPSPTSVSKRIIHPEPGDGNGVLYGRSASTEPLMSTVQATYGHGTPIHLNKKRASTSMMQY